MATVAEILAKQQKKPTVGEILERAKANPQAPQSPSIAARGISAIASGAAKQGSNFLSGANRQLSRAIAVPAELINEIAGFLGGPTFKAGKAFEDVENLFKRFGFVKEGSEGTTANYIGEKGAKGALTGLATLPLAPALAALPGSGPITEMGRNVGRFALEQTGKFIGTEAGAAVGADVASDIAGTPEADDSTLTKIGKTAAPVVGGIIGGGIGGAVKDAGEGLVSGATRAVKGVANAFRPSSGPTGGTPEQPIRPFGAQPDLAQVEARSFYDRDLQRIESDLDGIIQSVGGAASREDGSIGLRAAFQSAKTVAKGEEARYWNKVASRKPMRAEDTVNYILGHLAKLRQDNPRAVPEGLVADILRLTTKQTINKDGTVTYKLRPVPLERLRNLRSALRNDRWTEESGEGGRRAPEAARIAEMNQLENSLLGDIEKQLDGTQLTKFQEARAFSEKVNDIFRRGPIGAVLARGTGSGANRVLPEETMPAVLGRKQGVKDALPAETYNPQVRAEMENSVRAMFREEAERDPLKGRAWLRTNESRIKPLAAASHDLQQAVDGIGLKLAEKQALQKSALAKFTQEGADATTRVKNLFSSQTAEADAIQLRKSVEANPDALEGLQGAVIDVLSGNSGGWGSKLMRDLDNPRINKVLTAILDQRQLSGLKEVARVGQAIEEGNENTVRRLVGPTGRIISRIIGARLGTGINNVLGGAGNIQTPGLVARAFGNAFDAALNRVPLDKLVKAAILNPEARALLLRRGPSSISEAKQLAKLARRVIAGQAAVMDFFDGDRQEPANDQ